MISKLFEIEKTVKEKHLDEFNHVNNVQYLFWVQEIAKAHWRKLIQNKNISIKGSWIVRSHKIEYKNFTNLNDKIIVSTYVKNAKGFSSERLIKMKLKNSKKILIKCLTKCCFVELNTLKLKKIPQEIIRLLNNKN